MLRRNAGIGELRGPPEGTRQVRPACIPVTMPSVAAQSSLLCGFDWWPAGLVEAERPPIPEFRPPREGAIGRVLKRERSPVIHKLHEKSP